jgi:hypothetical protein
VAELGRLGCTVARRETPILRWRPTRLTNGPLRAPERTRTSGLPLRRLCQPVHGVRLGPLNCLAFAAPSAECAQSVAVAGVWVPRKAQPASGLRRERLSSDVAGERQLVADRALPAAPVVRCTPRELGPVRCTPREIGPELRSPNRSSIGWPVNEHQNFVAGVEGDFSSVDSRVGYGGTSELAIPAFCSRSSVQARPQLEGGVGTPGAPLLLQGGERARLVQATQGRECAA